MTAILPLGQIDAYFPSYLKRVIRTAWISLDTFEQMHVDTRYPWKPNEWHYRDWQGKNKENVLNERGEDYFLTVRRGYDPPPPSLSEKDGQNPQFDPNCKRVNPSFLPLGESLKDTSKRVINSFLGLLQPNWHMTGPYWSPRTAIHCTPL